MLTTLFPFSSFLPHPPPHLYPHNFKFSPISFLSSPLLSQKKKQKTNKTLKIKTEKQKKKLNKIDF